MSRVCQVYNRQSQRCYKKLQCGGGWPPEGAPELIAGGWGRMSDYPPGAINIRGQLVFVQDGRYRPHLFLNGHVGQVVRTLLFFGRSAGWMESMIGGFTGYFQSCADS